MDQIEAIVREVLTRLKGGGNPPPACDTLIPAEMSARHVHLSQEDLRELFGLDKLECVRNISQPGQFLSGCRVRLILRQCVYHSHVKALPRAYLVYDLIQPHYCVHDDRR